jgi:hypothetical protein
MRSGFLITLLAIQLSSLAAFGGAWEEIDGLNDAIKAGAELGKKIAKSLRQESSTVVALDVHGCSNSEKWCDAAADAVESGLLNSGIQFLPDSQREKIRQQIMEEGAYQQSSMMVDPKTAVQIGKQQSIQAFVSVFITGDESRIVIKSQSISMKSATVTFKHTATIERRQQVGQVFRGWGPALTWTSIGLGLTAMGSIKYLEYKQKADREYRSYKAASNSDDAVKYRTRTESADYWRNVAGGISILGLCIGGYGLSRLESYDVESGSFRLDVTVIPGGGLFALAYGF